MDKLPKYIIFTGQRDMKKSPFLRKMMLNSIYGANCEKYAHDDIATLLDEIYYLCSLNHSKGEKTMKIRSILANNQKKITTVVFNDGDVQMAKCHKDDEYDQFIGVALCIAQHLFGSKTQFHKFVKANVKGVKYELVEESKKEKK